MKKINISMLPENQTCYKTCANTLPTCETHAFVGVEGGLAEKQDAWSIAETALRSIHHYEN